MKNLNKKAQNLIFIHVFFWIIIPYLSCCCIFTVHLLCVRLFKSFISKRQQYKILYISSTEQKRNIMICMLIIFIRLFICLFASTILLAIYKVSSSGSGTQIRQLNFESLFSHSICIVWVSILQCGSSCTYIDMPEAISSRKWFVWNTKCK